MKTKQISAHIDPKDYTWLQKSLKKQHKAFSQWLRERINEEYHKELAK